MIWIIFLFLSIIFLMLSFYYERRYDYTYRTLFSTFTIISCIVILVLLLTGIHDYPWLISQKTRVESLKSEINTIKNSYYPVKKNGSLISGSLENMKQSTNLSEYISKYAVEKSEYNTYLVKIKFYNQSKLFWWIGRSMFISNEVKSLELME